MNRQRKRFSFKFTVALLAMFAMLALTLAGCGKKADDTNDSQDPGVSDSQPAQNNDSNEPDISAKPAQTKQKVTLYFSDDQAMYLAPEERIVTKGDETLEEVIIRELIKGPQKEGLGRTIPEGTELQSVSVVNGVAYVNFSKEFKTKHWGGSAGETMTLYSVVNSLCELPGIEKVQFLLEGEKQESILDGNMDTTVPIDPDFNLMS